MQRPKIGPRPPPGRRRVTNALPLVITAILAWIAIGVLGLVRPRNLIFVGRILFSVGAAVGFALAAVALVTMGDAPQTLVLPLGLPDLPFHVRLDALSAFFLFLLGSAGGGISIFSAGYFRASEGVAPGLLCLQFHTFLAAMALVFIADDAYVFMVAWETMALSSYFLVTTDHRIPEIRRAGFLYLLIAHIGAIGILLCFGVLQGGSGDYTFAGMRSVRLSESWASIAFLLALFGFGAKAGLVPLHVWLPEAHPAAPSPVSALMSGVMLKTAIYGLLRVTFDLLHGQLWWWGVVALGLGLVTALFGVIFAAVQTDMKRLLAYSSIENIGIIVAGIGLTILFKSYAKTLLAAITLAAVLYHSLNHAFFKSLLFLATGAVLHATKERNLGKLGGLIHRMPWVAWLALVGTLAIAGPAAVERFRLRMAAAAGVPVHTQPAAVVHQHAGTACGRRARARRRARRVRDGEILRRDLPRAAARGKSRLRPGPRLAGARRARLVRVRLRRTGAVSRQRDYDSSTQSTRH